MKIVGGPDSRKKLQTANKRSVVVDVMSICIANTNLALRTQNTLEKHGVLTVAQLAQKTVPELMAIPNLGAITIKTLRLFLDKLEVEHRLNEVDEVKLQSDKKRLDARNRKNESK
jgi:DNA-directed RNA polymerase alpha subunit